MKANDHIETERGHPSPPAPLPQGARGEKTVREQIKSELGRVYGISAVRVRQIRDAAIRKIKEIYGRHGLLPPEEGFS